MSRAKEFVEKDASKISYRNGLVYFKKPDEVEVDTNSPEYKKAAKIKKELDNFSMRIGDIASSISGSISKMSFDSVPSDINKLSNQIDKIKRVLKIK